MRPPQIESLAKSVDLMVTQVKDGELPESLTVGVEIEGGLYTQNGRLFHAVGCDGKPILGRHHTEYMTSTLESACPPLHTKNVRDLPRAVALALSAVVTESCDLAREQAATVVYSSTFEGGSWEQQRVNPCLEIQRRGQNGLDVLKNSVQDVPNQTVLLYRAFGTELGPSFRANVLLPWPTHAVHVHTGAGQWGVDFDVRTACVRTMMRNSAAAKVMSFTLFNTNKALGIDLTTQGINADARAVFRRLAPTSRGFFCPLSAGELMRTISSDALEVRDGKAIRVAASAAHDRVRLRLGPNVTVESVDGAMTPDLRKVIAWVLFQVLLDIIAMEAIASSHGREEVAIRRLANRELFRPLPTVGTRRSAIGWDESFNRQLWLSRASGTRMPLLGLALELSDEVRELGRRIPTMSGICSIVAACIEKECQENVPRVSVAEYLGIRKGQFFPGLGGVGPLSLRKTRCEPVYLVDVVGRATLLQARALAKVRDAEDVEAFCS